MDSFQPFTRLDKEVEINSLKTELQQELEHILSWWMHAMEDNERGGFYGRMDGMGRLHPEADKSVMLNTRILWTFSAAARPSGNMLYKHEAARAYDYLLQYFWDELEGGVYWMVDCTGQAIQTKKQIDAQAAAIHAFVEYYLLTQSEGSLAQAVELFWLIEHYSRDKQRGGYYESFNRNWRPIEDLHLSEKDAHEDKTINTHLHLLEAYTNLYRAYRNEAVYLALQDLIYCFLERFMHLQTAHLWLFFDKNWNWKSDEISFGHDMECSWLLVEAAEVLGNSDLLKKVKQVAVQLATTTLQEGVDRDGGIFSTANPHGLLDTNKLWWPQAEAMVGFLTVYQLSGGSSFLAAALQSWNFIKTYLKDSKNGEWFWGVTQGGAPLLTEDKAGFLKAPYHNGRACLEVLQRLA